MLRIPQRALQRPAGSGPSAAKKATQGTKFSFYDLVLRTPSHPREPLEVLLMSQKELKKLRGETKTTFEGNYSLDQQTPEERIAKVFGGRIKGEERQSSSRREMGQPRMIAGVNVPDKPKEPDNCCMSGCINCVWELFNDDLKDWNEKRSAAAENMRKQGGVWPADFYPPMKHLNPENIPAEAKREAQSRPAKSDAEEAWGNVPVSIRVFAQTEKRLKSKKHQKEKQKKDQQSNTEASL